MRWSVRAFVGTGLFVSSDIESPARAPTPVETAVRSIPWADCALDCPASHPKAGHRHEPVELRKGPPPPHRRLERAKSGDGISGDSKIPGPAIAALEAWQRQAKAEETLQKVKDALDR